MTGLDGPWDEPTAKVPARAYLEGFKRAVQAFHDEAQGHEPERAFRPIFEALAWAFAIDERLREAWAARQRRPTERWADSFANGGVANGVRWARNSVAHVWGDAVWPSRSSASVTGIEWKWKPSSQLPEPQNRGGRKDYERYVAGQKVRVTFQQLGDCFGDAFGELNP